MVTLKIMLYLYTLSYKSHRMFRSPIKCLKQFNILQKYLTGTVCTVITSINNNYWFYYSYKRTLFGN